MGLSGEEVQQLVVRGMWKNMIGERPTVQTGESANQAKVFKAHALPQGLCENLIIALNVVGEPTERW